MDVLFLGTGTSHGMPMMVHDNEGVDWSDARNWRTRSSLHVVLGEHHVQVDAGQDFRIQALRHDLRRVDTFLLTHGHADHVLGMDDLRRFCDLREGAPLPVFSTEEGLARVQAIYPYAIGERPVAKGYACFRPTAMPPCLEVPGGRIHAVHLPHGRVATLGLVFEEDATGARFAYYTDCKAITPEGLERARGAQGVVLDGLRYKWHDTHMTIEEAVAVSQAMGAPRTWLTHLAWPVDHATCEREHLPPSVRLAYDGLCLRVTGSGVTAMPAPVSRFGVWPGGAGRP